MGKELAIELDRAYPPISNASGRAEDKARTESRMREHSSSLNKHTFRVPCVPWPEHAAICDKPLAIFVEEESVD